MTPSHYPLFHKLWENHPDGIYDEGRWLEFRAKWHEFESILRNVVIEWPGPVALTAIEMIRTTLLRPTFGGRVLSLLKYHASTSSDNGDLWRNASTSLEIISNHTQTILFAARLTGLSPELRTLLDDLKMNFYADYACSGSGCRGIFFGRAIRYNVPWFNCSVCGNEVAGCTTCFKPITGLHLQGQCPNDLEIPQAELNKTRP